MDSAAIKATVGAADGAAILDLPVEVLSSIFQWLSPIDMAAVSGTCRAFQKCVVGNQKLWRDIYLQTLDPPPADLDDWEQAVHDKVRFEAVCLSSNRSLQEAELLFVAEMVVRLLRTASSAPVEAAVIYTAPAEIPSRSRNASLLTRLLTRRTCRAAFLTRSHLFERVRNRRRGGDAIGPIPVPVSNVRQLSAKLHCLWGVPIMMTETHPYACSRTYDVLQYEPEVRWGPYLDQYGGTVDWEKLEAAFINLAFHLGLRRIALWQTEFSGAWPGSFRSVVLHEPAMAAAAAPPSQSAQATPAGPADPYGATGTWLRMICFLDFHVFSVLNFSREAIADTANTPRQATNVFRSWEVVKFMAVRIEVDKVLPAGPDNDQTGPITHFTGKAFPLGDDGGPAQAAFSGTIGMTKDGEVRWSTTSSVGNQARWRSESIQIGGANSGRGLLGNWFPHDYSPRGPCGSSAAWKVSDSVDAPMDMLRNMIQPVEEENNHLGWDYSQAGADVEHESWPHRA